MISGSERYTTIRFKGTATIKNRSIESVQMCVIVYHIALIEARIIKIFHRIFQEKTGWICFLFPTIIAHIININSIVN